MRRKRARMQKKQNKLKHRKQTKRVEVNCSPMSQTLMTIRLQGLIKVHLHCQRVPLRMQRSSFANLTNQISTLSQILSWNCLTLVTWITSSNQIWRKVFSVPQILQSTEFRLPPPPIHSTVQLNWIFLKDSTYRSIKSLKFISLTDLLHLLQKIPKKCGLRMESCTEIQLRAK